MTPKERIQATIRGQAYDRPAVTPIFMSRAAGFIGRTYRDYYLDGDVLAESQLAVMRAFNLDQVSAISDPWREASAYGMEFDYPEHGVGRPRGVLIRSPQDISRVRPFALEQAERPAQRIGSVRKMPGRRPNASVLGWLEGRYRSRRLRAALKACPRPDRYPAVTSARDVIETRSAGPKAGGAGATIGVGSDYQPADVSTVRPALNHRRPAPGRCQAPRLRRHQQQHPLHGPTG
jgi:hypothetical protein